MLYVVAIIVQFAANSLYYFDAIAFHGQVQRGCSVDVSGRHAFVLIASEHFAQDVDTALDGGLVRRKPDSRVLREFLLERESFRGFELLSAASVQPAV